MTLLSRLITWLGWDPPVATPRSRPRRLRMTCAACGKDLAVIRSTGALWKHKCRELPSERRDSIIDPRD